MCTTTVPATAAQALAMLESALGFLAADDPAALPAQAAADRLRALERADAIQAAVRARLLHAFDAQDGHLADGQRTTRAWLIHSTRVTKGQAGEYKAVQALARDHQVLLAALAEGHVLTKSVALQLARWTKAIPDQYRGKAEEILVGAARAGAGLRSLAAICAEIRALTAEPDPDGRDPGLDRALTLDTTLDGAGVLRAGLTPGCAAMVQAVLDALSAPRGGEDQRTRPQRYHDALEEAMRRLLASDLLPKRAGQPVKALVHVSFADLCQLDAGSGIQDRWIGVYRTRWAAHRAAAAVSAGDGGAWLGGDAARKVACDAMIIPVVTADIDPAAVEDLILLCVRFHDLPRPGPARPLLAPGLTPAPAYPAPANPAPADPAPQTPQSLCPRRPRTWPRPRTPVAGPSLAWPASVRPRRAGRAGHRRGRRRPGRAGTPDPGQDPAGRLRPRRRRLRPAPPAARQTPGRPLPPPRRRRNRRHPGPPAAPGRPPGPDMPVPRRL